MRRVEVVAITAVAAFLVLIFIAVGAMAGTRWVVQAGLLILVGVLAVMIGLAGSNTTQANPKIYEKTLNSTAWIVTSNATCSDVWTASWI